MTRLKLGKLICVGTGMRMAGQVTPLARSHIETADVVVSAVPNIFTRNWIQGIAKEFICVLGYYTDCDVDGKNRRDTYRRMADTIFGERARWQDGLRSVLRPPRHFCLHLAHGHQGCAG